MTDLVPMTTREEWSEWSRRELLDEIERLQSECDEHAAAYRRCSEERAKLEAVVDAAKGVTEYGEVAFMGVNIPFKSFRKLKEALDALEDDDD